MDKYRNEIVAINTDGFQHPGNDNSNKMEEEFHGDNLTNENNLKDTATNNCADASPEKMIIEEYENANNENGIMVNQQLNSGNKKIRSILERNVSLDVQAGSNDNFNKLFGGNDNNNDNDSDDDFEIEIEIDDTKEDQFNFGKSSASLIENTKIVQDWANKKKVNDKSQAFKRPLGDAGEGHLIRSRDDFIKICTNKVRERKSHGLDADILKERFKVTT